MSHRVLVNDRYLYRPGAGVVTYLRNLLAHWPEDAAAQPVGFCARKRPPAPSSRTSATTLRLRPLRNIRPAVDAGPVRRWVQRRLLRAYDRRLHAERASGDYAAYFEPGHLAVPCDGPTVATMHDLSVLDCPQWHPPHRAAYWQECLETAVASTDCWIAVSAFTKHRMVERLGIATGRIEVIPLAPRPLPQAGDPTALQDQRGLPETYLLHLGALEPRKNLHALLDAWAATPGPGGAKLIFAGPTGWGSRDYWKSLRQHPAAESVLATGPISDDLVALLLAGARAVLAPSHYEGFGLPIVEAMAAGTPVVCSTAEAFAEVAGDAADFVDPADTNGWAQAIERACTDDDWRAQRRQAGLARASRFSWHETARRHADLIARAVATPPS